MKLFRKDGAAEEEQDPTIPELRRRLAAVQLPPAVESVAERELDLLSRISPAAAEYTIGLTYLEYLAALPWHRTRVACRASRDRTDRRPPHPASPASSDAPRRLAGSRNGLRNNPP